MSHFYLYPLLLSQGLPPFQIQQILHSFGLFTNHPLQNSLFSSSASQTQNMINRPPFSRNLIIQQSTNGVCNLESKNQNCSFRTLMKLHQQKQDSIKEQHHESQQKTSDRLVNGKKDQESVISTKNKKKKKITKISLKQKRQKQLKRNQTENSKRNVIPNQIHQMLSILFKKKKSFHLVEKLIEKYSSLYSLKNLSVQRFYLYQSLLKDRINHYANQHSLKILLQHLEPACRIYQKQEQSVYCRMGLSLIRYFLNNQASLVILNSKRIKSENKLEHLKTKRYLVSVLKQLIQTQGSGFSQ